MNYSNRIITIQLPRNQNYYLYLSHPGGLPNSGSSGCYSLSIVQQGATGALRTAENKDNLMEDLSQEKVMHNGFSISPNPLTGWYQVVLIEHS